MIPVMLTPKQDQRKSDNISKKITLTTGDKDLNRQQRNNLEDERQNFNHILADDDDDYDQAVSKKTLKTLASTMRPPETTTNALFAVNDETSASYNTPGTSPTNSSKKQLRLVAAIPSPLNNSSNTPRGSVNNQRLQQITKVEKELAWQRKERKLEQHLRSRHCRPLVKLFKLQRSTKIFNLEEEGADEGGESV